MRGLLFCLLLAGCASPAQGAPPSSGPPPVTDRRPVGVGHAAPAIDLRAIDGTRTGIVVGKVNVVFFWATWSEPDKKSFPAYAALWERHRDEGLAVLGISVDDEPDGVPEFARSYHGKFAVAWDAGRRVADRYAPSSEPTSYVIDRKGVVRFLHAGWHDGEIVPLEAEVEALLRER